MNVPKIRFKEFSQEWEECTVNDITNRYDNLRIPVKESERKKGNIPYYGANGIQDYVDGYTHDGAFVLVAEDGANDLDHYPVQYSEGRIWVNNHAHVLGAKGDNSALFLKYLISEADIKSHLVGGGRAKLNAEVLMRLSLIKPVISEQKKIAEYFKNLDSLIEATGKKVASLKQTKQACLQSMFPQPGETTPRIRFKGFEGDWEKKQIGDISTSSKGNGYSKADLRLEGTPIVLYGRMYTKYSFEMDNVDTFATPKDGAVYSKGNEVVIPASGETAEDIAIAAAIKQSGVILGGDLNILTFDDDYLPSFMALCISNSETHYELSKYAQGKSVVHLRNNDIAKGTVTCPSLAEQQQIASFFSNLDKQIALQEQQLEKLKQVKAACLDNMFV